jgi:hypothetical protein
MPLLPIYTEQLYSPLPPADLLRRLTDRTALVQYTPALGGVTLHTQHQLMHLFEGTITGQHFVIRRIAQRGKGFNWAWNFGASGQAEPNLEGWVTTAATGGTWLQLRYQPPLASWGLLLVPAGALLKLTTDGKPLVLALIESAAVSALAWLLAWGVFRHEVTQWRRELAELLQLQTGTTA